MEKIAWSLHDVTCGFMNRELKLMHIASLHNVIIIMIFFLPLTRVYTFAAHAMQRLQSLLLSLM